MIVYIPEHKFGAGKPIYRGYFAAFEHLGYDVEWYSSLDDLDSLTSGSMLMCTDSMIKSEKDMDILSFVKKVFLFVQPHTFPQPWGSHPNFVTQLSKRTIEEINKIDSVYKWTFTKAPEEYYDLWSDVHSVSLAFDNINYKPMPADDRYCFDVVYVGGRADNGFDEKWPIMKEYFKALMQTNLKCGIFINKNLSHEDENRLLWNSKVGINIHDRYQRELRLDLNERHFKVLGLTGCLVSDLEATYRRQNLGHNQFGEFPFDITRPIDACEEFFVKSPSRFAEECKSLARRGCEEREAVRSFMAKQHTYTNRLEYMLR